MGVDQPQYSPESAQTDSADNDGTRGIIETVRLVIVPGIGNSGPQHWQSKWEAKYRDQGAVRVVQSNWDDPEKNEWVKALDARVRENQERDVLVGHSLGCLAIVHWVRAGIDKTLAEKIKGALLVAPTNPETYPGNIKGFAPTPMNTLPFPSILVASTNDPWIPIERSKEFARAWGARFVNLGERGHINAASNLGEWPEGQEMLQEFIAA